MKSPDLHCHSTFSSAMTSGDALLFTEVEEAWLAGILEGEAWFGERKPHGRHKNRRPLIAVKMCDRDVVERVAELFGGTAVTLAKPESGNSRAQWVTRASSVRAISVMRAVQPYMGERRRAQIEWLLLLYG